MCVHTTQAIHDILLRKITKHIYFQSPIRMFYSKKDEAAHYADTLIGYATVAGGTTRLSNNGGSCYTNILTSCLYNHGAK